MPKNRTTDESSALDAEDWQIVFQAYAEYPILAFILAQHFNYLKELIEHGRRAEATEAADRAIESLMPYTDYRDAGRTIYLQAVAGTLPPSVK